MEIDPIVIVAVVTGVTAIVVAVVNKWRSRDAQDLQEQLDAVNIQLDNCERDNERNKKIIASWVKHCDALSQQVRRYGGNPVEYSFPNGELEQDTQPMKPIQFLKKK